MRVSAHVEKPGSQLMDGGVMSMLAGGIKDSFASLLGGAETVETQVEDHGPLEHPQSGLSARVSHREESGHMRKARPSEHQRDPSLSGRAEPSVVIGDSRPKVPLERPSWTGDPRKQNGANSTSGARKEAVTVSSSERASTVVPASSDSNENRTRSHMNTAETSSSRYMNETGTVMRDSLEGDSEADGSQQAGSSIDASGVFSNGASLGGDDLGLATAEAGLPRAFPSKQVILGDLAQSAPVQPRLSAAAGSPASASAPFVNRVTGDLQSAQGNDSEGGAGNQAGTRERPWRHEAQGEAVKAEQIKVASAQSTGGSATGPTSGERIAARQQTSLESSSGQSTRSSASEATLRSAGIEHLTDANSTRVLASATRGELQVGVHTEAFGRVSIQTARDAGQLSAQVSLEDTRQSAVLAAHLPAVEQRIAQQHGLDASVRILGESHAGSRNGTTGDSQHGSHAGSSAKEGRPTKPPFDRGFSQPRSSAAVPAGARSEGHRQPGRLSVTV
jgi:hypothetical protein